MNEVPWVPIECVCSKRSLSSNGPQQPGIVAANTACTAMAATDDTTSSTTNDCWFVRIAFDKSGKGGYEVRFTNLRHIWYEILDGSEALMKRNRNVNPVLEMELDTIKQNLKLACGCNDDGPSIATTPRFTWMMTSDAFDAASATTAAAAAATTTTITTTTMTTTSAATTDNNITISLRLPLTEGLIFSWRFDCNKASSAQLVYTDLTAPLMDMILAYRIQCENVSIALLESKKALSKALDSLPSTLSQQQSSSSSKIIATCLTASQNGGGNSGGSGGGGGNGGDNFGTIKSKSTQQEQALISSAAEAVTTMGGRASCSATYASASSTGAASEAIANASVTHSQPRHRHRLVFDAGGRAIYQEIMRRNNNAGMTAVPQVVSDATLLSPDPSSQVYADADATQPPASQPRTVGEGSITGNMEELYAVASATVASTTDANVVAVTETVGRSEGSRPSRVKKREAESPPSMVVTPKKKKKKKRAGRGLLS